MWLVEVGVVLLAPTPVEAALWMARHGHGHGHGLRRAGHGGCAAHEADFGGHVVDWLGEELDLDGPQRAALQPMIDVATDFHDRTAALCDAEFDGARSSLVAIRVHRLF